MIQNIFDDSYKNSALRSPLWEKEFRSVEYARQGSSWKIMKENRVKTEVEGKTGKGVWNTEAASLCGLRLDLQIQ